MSITSVSSGGTVAWGGGGALGAPLAGFGLGDTLDLSALTFRSGGSATLSGLVLDVTEGSTTDSITFASGTDFSGMSFSLSSGGLGGTAVTLAPISGGALLPVHGGG